MALPIQRPAGLDRFIQAEEGSNEYKDSLDSVSAQLQHAQLNVTQLVCHVIIGRRVLRSHPFANIPIMQWVLVISGALKFGHMRSGGNSC